MSVNVPLRTVYAYDLLNPLAIGRRVDAAVDNAVRGGLVVGTQVRIALDGRNIYQRDAGMLDYAGARPVTPRSVFRLSCLSRLLVAVAALTLVQQERLSLDEDIRQWLPDLHLYLPDGTPVSVTVRQLLSHCAGFAKRLPSTIAAGGYLDASIADDQQLPGHLRQLSLIPLRYRPGSAWGYSMASDVLAGLVAQVCDGSLEGALQQRVSGPLQLNTTAFSSQGEPPGPVYVNGQALSPSPNGMLGTASDYLRLVEALRVGDNSPLSKILIGEMASVQTGDLQLPEWPGRGFGLGFTLLRDPMAANSPESPGTWRMDSACGHSWFVDPLKRLSVVAFTNTAVNGQDSPFAIGLRNAVYGV
jgi:CubicO group peptidase (beta-lactamase class C family)